MHSVYVSFENGKQFYVNSKFLQPGKNFFNERLADQNIEIPEKKIKSQKVKEKVLTELFDSPMEEGEEGKEEVVLNIESKTEEDEDDSW